MSRLRSFLAVSVAALAACAGGEAESGPDGAPADDARPSAADPDTAWTPIFNGQDLSGWTPKIRFSEVGVDSLETFRVEDGLFTVSYDGYTNFGDR